MKAILGLFLKYQYLGWYCCPYAEIQYFGAILVDWFSWVKIVWTKKGPHLTDQPEITNALKYLLYFCEKQIFFQKYIFCEYLLEF